MRARSCRVHVVLLHGFAQSEATWSSIVIELKARRPDWTCHTPILPGHGRFPTPALDVARAAQSLAGFAAGMPPAIWVGYSFGGRHVLRVALDCPAAVAAVVTVGATPGIRDAEERALRRRSDAELADRIEAIGTEAFLAEWTALPLFGGVSDEPNSARAAAGTAAGWAESLRLAGTGAMEPMWDRLGEVAVPCRFLAGARDAKFTAIGSEMAARVTDGVFSTVARAFHNAHVTNPVAIVDQVLAAAESIGRTEHGRR